jgi:hypothetical protein
MHVATTQPHAYGEVKARSSVRGVPALSHRSQLHHSEPLLQSSLLTTDADGVLHVPLPEGVEYSVPRVAVRSHFSVLVTLAVESMHAVSVARIDVAQVWYWRCSRDCAVFPRSTALRVRLLFHHLHLHLPPPSLPYLL